MKNLIKKLDKLATSGMFDHDEILMLDRASVCLVLGDVTTAISILDKMGVSLC